jgi:gas vesicle protein
MSEQSRVVIAGLAGAAIGSLVGYLYMTTSGRRVRDQIEPKLDEFVREMRRMQKTVRKAQEAANEGWKSLNELFGDHPGNGQLKQPPGQSSPF